MKRFIIGVIKFFRITFEFLDYLLRMLLYENFINYSKKGRIIKKCKSNEVVLLANGPSLSLELDRIKNKDLNFLNKDFCVVNYIAESEIYEIIKPKYYVVTDCQFFLETHKNYDRAQIMFEKIISCTDWDMNIYIQYRDRNRFDYERFSKNSNINIKLIHSTPFGGFESLRFFFYKNGLGNGEFGSVILNAEYVMLNYGYSKLHLYGVDHNFFDGLCLNDDNVLCLRDTHYYDSTKPKITPTNWNSVSDFLFCYADLFRGHKIMNEYAKALNINIYNHTKNSLIDSYQKVSVEN